MSGTQHTPAAFLGVTFDGNVNTVAVASAESVMEALQAGAKVVCLVPARTDTAWWHDYAAKGAVTFIRGRLKFGDAASNAPFPSALVIFQGGAA